MSLTGEHTILLVEDNPMDVMFLRRAFRELGVTHRLATVSDGSEAIQYLDGKGPYANRHEFPIPKLILLDLGLPGINGFQVLQWLRCHETLRHLIVIILSSSVFSPDIKRAYSLGANSFLVKPAGLSELTAAIKTLLDFWLAKATLPDSPPKPSDDVIPLQQPALHSPLSPALKTSTPSA
jgi:CheY-like chemotaxis protein